MSNILAPITLRAIEIELLLVLNAKDLKNCIKLLHDQPEDPLKLDDIQKEYGKAIAVYRVIMHLNGYDA